MSDTGSFNVLMGHMRHGDEDAAAEPSTASPTGWRPSTAAARVPRPRQGDPEDIVQSAFSTASRRSLPPSAVGPGGAVGAAQGDHAPQGTICLAAQRQA
jgi:hypothetical protein